MTQKYGHELRRLFMTLIVSQIQVANPDKSFIDRIPLPIV